MSVEIGKKEICMCTIPYEKTPILLLFQKIPVKNPHSF